MLLAIYIQSVYLKIVIKNLYAIPPSLRDSVCLLYKTFSLSLQIAEDPKENEFGVIAELIIIKVYLKKMESSGILT